MERRRQLLELMSDSVTSVGRIDALAVGVVAVREAVRDGASVVALLENIADGRARVSTIPAVINGRSVDYRLKADDWNALFAVAAIYAGRYVDSARAAGVTFTDATAPKH